MTFTLSFEDIHATDPSKVGGKGANLGEMAQAGFNIPPGFCVTTDAFWRFMEGVPQDVYAKLEEVTSEDIEKLRKIGQEVRNLLRQAPLPKAIGDSVVNAWLESGKEYPYAVRSSATAEDLPHASFAGQHDTYLNIRGKEALLESVKACFISLFTDRAILYRMQNGFDHRRTALAVVVQRMVQSEVSGILFTADPVSGNRNIASIDASFGLGEALVSGLVSADLYQVDRRTYRIVQRKIASKEIAIRPVAEGGTERVEVPEEERTRAALTDSQIIELVRLGNQIEAHYGKPQDIEWALAEDGILYVTQSRPITSLYPLPQPQPNDDALHVYASISHQQGMTACMTPLALSVLRILLPVGHAHGRFLESQYLASAGGRLYGDVSPLLRHPLGERFLVRVLEYGEPLAIHALVTLAKRPRFRERGERFNPIRAVPAGLSFLPKIVHSLFLEKPENSPQETFALIEAHLTEVQSRLESAREIREKLDIAVNEMQRIFTPVLSWAPKLGSGLIAEALLRALMRKRVEEETLIALGRGLVGNIETEMNLAVGDIANAARTSEALLSLLGETSLDAKTRLARASEMADGTKFLDAWNRFMEKYGMRGLSEIDISRPRWSEDPSSLLQMVLNATKSEEAGAHRIHYQTLIAEAESAAEKIIEEAQKGLWGWIRAPLVRRLLLVSRQFMPLRGHHKYLVVRLLGLIKPVFLEAGETLCREGRLETAEDIWFLTLPEISEALESEENLKPRIAERRKEYEHDQTLTPPRVITSEGEIPATKLEGVEAPAGALIGSPVSAGVVEGVARVILDPAAETLRPGEILIAPFTDPGWTPLFVNAAGLVTEVGGLMTHGAVVAREYGIPAIVGVIEATKKIKTGQRIRVHGNAGYVEFLDELNKTEPST